MSTCTIREPWNQDDLTVEIQQLQHTERWLRRIRLQRRLWLPEMLIFFFPLPPLKIDCDWRISVVPVSLWPLSYQRAISTVRPAADCECFVSHRCQETPQAATSVRVTLTLTHSESLKKNTSCPILTFSRYTNAVCVLYTHPLFE